MTEIFNPEPTPLSEADIDQALALSLEAGWNQTAADWRLMISIGDAVAIRTDDGRVVASAIALPQGADFAWLSMILVTADYQRQNIASGLLAHLITGVEVSGRVPGLDATPAGKTVYEPLGFQPVYEINRWQAAEPGWSAPAPVPAGITVKTATAEDLSDILDFDQPRFGGGRKAILEHLLQRCPDQALVARHDADQSLAGYVLARDGRESLQVGPLVATSEQIALDLMDRALGSVDGPLYIDVPDHQELLSAWLKSRGFTIQRPFTRMLIGRTAPFDQPSDIFAIAGPELG
jgi:GNAT superfamily N-acetyltransferase